MPPRIGRALCESGSCVVLSMPPKYGSRVPSVYLHHRFALDALTRAHETVPAAPIHLNDSAAAVADQHLRRRWTMNGANLKARDHLTFFRVAVATAIERP